MYVENTNENPPVTDKIICYLNGQNMSGAKSFRFTDDSYAIFRPYTVHDERHEKQADLIAFGFYLDDSCGLDIKNSAHKDANASIGCGKTSFVGKTVFAVDAR